jgi:RNA polymerase-binding transcription factor DksA
MTTKALTQRDLQTLERLLRAQHAALLGEAEQLETEATGTPGAPLEQQAEAEIVEREWDIDLELLADEDRVLREIVAALARVRDGTYGRCEDCRRWIPRARLAVVPYARRCVACESARA